MTKYLASQIQTQGLLSLKAAVKWKLNYPWKFILKLKSPPQFHLPHSARQCEPLLTSPGSIKQIKPDCSVEWHFRSYWKRVRQEKLGPPCSKTKRCIQQGHSEPQHLQKLITSSSSPLYWQSTVQRSPRAFSTLRAFHPRPAIKVLINPNDKPFSKGKARCASSPRSRLPSHPEQHRLIRGEPGTVMASSPDREHRRVIAGAFQKLPTSLHTLRATLLPRYQLAELAARV